MAVTATVPQTGNIPAVGAIAPTPPVPKPGVQTPPPTTPVVPGAPTPAPVTGGDVRPSNPYDPFAASGGNVTVNPQSASGATSPAVTPPTMDSGLLSGAQSAVATAANPAATVGFTGYDAAKANASTYAPTNATAAQWNVDPNQLTSTNLNKVIDSNSPLMQQAKTTSDQNMNARGLLSSSMAEQAGQAAVINAALPIAQSDAQTQAAAAAQTTQNQQQTNLTNATAGNAAGQYNAGNTQQTDLTNAAAKNTEAQFNAQGKLTADQQNAQASNSLQSQALSATNALVGQNFSAAFQAQMATADNATKVELQNINSQTQLNLGNIQASYQRLISSNTTAQTLWSNMQSEITSILNNANLDATTKGQMIGQATQSLGNAYQVMDSITGLNLSAMYTPSNYGGLLVNPPAPPPPGGYVPGVGNSGGGTGDGSGGSGDGGGGGTGSS